MKHAAVVLAAMVFLSGRALAHGEAEANKNHASHAATEETPFGRAGDPKRVKRVVRVDMSDAMRFTPAEIRVKRGDTVRFALKNSGKLLHEMVLGTDSDLKGHADMMRKMPGMEHHEPYMVHVRPGRSGQLVWQFTKPGEFRYGCLIPGHFEAGMVGKLTVE
jgi:uncharacterized cupredoxin-like copper-binding protein